MFLMNTTEKMFMLVFLVSSMLSIGMQTRISDVRSLAASKTFLVRALLANFLVVPIVGVAIALLVPLQPYVAAALVLLACTPGGLSALQFTTKVRGGASLAGAIMFLLSILALFVSPIILRLVLPEAAQIVIPYDRILLFLLVCLLLPALAGMLLLGALPAAASKLSRLLALVGLVAFVAFMVVTGSARKAAAGEIGLAAVGAMLLFIVLSMVVGWLMGGPEREHRRMLATATSMRNAALCLAIVESSRPGHIVLVPLIAFSMLMVPPNMLLSLYGAVRDKRRAKA